jgi:hypothetical protein
MNAVLVIILFLLGVVGIGYTLYLPYDSELGEQILVYSAVAVVLPFLLLRDY